MNDKSDIAKSAGTSSEVGEKDSVSKRPESESKMLTSILSADNAALPITDEQVIKYLAERLFIAQFRLERLRDLSIEARKSNTEEITEVGQLCDMIDLYSWGSILLPETRGTGSGK